MATVRITGTGFTPASVVYVDGSPVGTEYESDTELYATFSTGTAGVRNIEVRNGAEASSSVGLTVISAGGGSNNPLPVLSSIGSTTSVADDLDIPKTATGSSFVASSLVWADNDPLPTTYVSATSLSFTIPAALASVVGTSSITVRTGAPGGGTSANAITYTVTSRVPVLASSAPPSAVKRASPEITVTGSGFEATSVVRVNGVDAVTTYDSPTQLRAIVPASVMALTGAYTVRVFNPGPGGGLSVASTNFSVTYTWQCDLPEVCFEGGNWLTSGSNITQWNDSSGNGRNAVQASAGLQPLASTIGSVAAANFTSNTRAMSIASPLPAGPRTVLIVRKHNALPGATVTTCAFNVKTAGKVFSEYGYSGNVGAGFTTHYCTAGLAGGGGAVNTVGHNTAADTNRHVDVFQDTGTDPMSTGTYTLYLDGVSRTVVASGSISPTASNLQSIGGRLTSTNTVNGGCNTLMSLLVSWPRVLNSAELADALALAANY